MALTTTTARPVAGNVQQLLLALYGRGYPCTPEWIKTYGLLTAITAPGRKTILRLARRATCLACENALPDDSDGDHAVALANGGDAGIGNYLPLCGRCNSSKGKRDLLDWWAEKGRSAAEIPPDALVVYARRSFAQHVRLGTLNDLAGPGLAWAVGELLARLDREQERMLRLRISWVTGRRWT